jgi:hypothetical protein
LPTLDKLASNLNRPTNHVLATVNGVVVADDEHTQQIGSTMCRPEVRLYKSQWAGAVSTGSIIPLSVAQSIVSAGILVLEGMFILGLFLVARDNGESIGHRQSHR